MRIRRQTTDTKGFTIIEVMIVLAIAGLIMVIVFLALRTMQHHRRDFQRKRYADRVFAQMGEYYVNNHRYPGTPAERQHFIDAYMPKEVDPGTGVDYTSTPELFRGPTDPHNFSPPPSVGQIHIQSAHWCNTHGDGDNETDAIAGTDSNTNRYVVWIYTETGEFYCLDNNFNSY